MLSTQHVVRSNKAAQSAGELARTAVDQAAVVVVDKSKVAAQQAAIAARIAGTAVVAFARSFLRR